MAIDKIQTAGLGENIEIGGTEAAKMPVGTTAQRANVQAGDIRFNSSSALMEYYDGTQWKSIDSPPSISSISPSNIADSDSSVDITVTGSNFITGGQVVTAVGADGSTITAGTVTRVSNTELTANFNGTSFDNAQEPYDIKVENSASSLSIISADLLNVNASPAWTVSAGSLGTIYDSGRTGVSITTGATDSEGASLTYSVSVGSLPAGLSIDSSTGTISGTATAVGSDTTSTFTLAVTDGTNSVTRQYSITVNAPVVTSYTSTGSGTFTVPSGVTAVDVLVVAGGGGGGCWVASGAGAGGLIYRPAFPVTPGGSVSYTVGNGGSGAYNNGSYSDLADAQPNQITEYRGNEAANAAKAGQDSVFGTLTAIGGGRGGTWTNPVGGEQGHLMGNGGSGGGTTGNASAHPQLGGTKVSDFQSAGVQPQQPGDSGTYGFGNSGGAVAQSDPFSPNYYGGGGGGAGAAGSQGQGQTGPAGPGGIGKQYDISGTQVYYAGGGGGGAHTSGSGQVSNGGQGGGGDGFYGTAGQNPTRHATQNRGGGGGGQGQPGSVSSQGGNGGSGIVIVKY